MTPEPTQTNDLSERLDRLATFMSQLSIEHAHLAALGEDNGPASNPAIARRVAEMGRLIRELMGVTLGLPLTVALFEALIARVGDERYLFRLGEVAEVVRPGKASLVQEAGVEQLALRDRKLPVLRLADWLGRGTATTPGHVGAALIARRPDGAQLALLVDDVVETQQILCRPLGKDLRELPGFAGGAILADGAAALVLDIQQILETAA